MYGAGQSYPCEAHTVKIEHLEGTALELKDGVKEVSKKVDALKDWIRAVLLLVVVELAAVAFKGLKG